MSKTLKIAILRWSLIQLHIAIPYITFQTMTMTVPKIKCTTDTNRSRNYQLWRYVYISKLRKIWYQQYIEIIKPRSLQWTLTCYVTWYLVRKCKMNTAVWELRVRNTILQGKFSRRYLANGWITGQTERIFHLLHLWNENVSINIVTCSEKWSDNWKHRKWAQSMSTESNDAFFNSKRVGFVLKLESVQLWQ